MAEEYTMKKSIVLVALVALLLALPLLIANPLIPRYFNELKFTSDSWILEMNHEGQMVLDGLLLTSKKDTAYFKSGIAIGPSSYVLITPESLQSRLTIDPLGDSITLRAGQGVRAMLVFGESKGSAIHAPKPGQSISFSGTYFYFDNSPTLGRANDTLNACGTIKGTVRDSKGAPIIGAQVLYGSWMSTAASTDSSGSYMICSISARLQLAFSVQNYISEYRTIQVWPESTIDVSVTMQPVVSVPKDMPQGLAKDFQLGDPYPNPFNPSTTFVYALPRDSKVELRVLDLNGKVVDQLYSGFQRSGQYRAMWNAEACPSGVYFLLLRTPGVTLSKKCLLVK
jgi:hypothetical protein